MNDIRDPFPPGDPSPGSDEALSAYLLGELDAVDTEAFERRLGAEPALRARLDVLADALLALSGAEQVDEPAGFAERLEARLAAEADTVDLDERRRRRQRWTTVTTAAAGVVVLAVAGLQVLGGSSVFLGGEDLAQDEAVEELAAPGMDGMRDSVSLESGPIEQEYRAESRIRGDDDTFAPEPMDTHDGGLADGAEKGPHDSAAGGGTSGGVPAASNEERGAPVVLDEGAALENDEDLRARYMSLPEAERFRGMPRDEAAETAARHADHVRASEAFSSGVRPDACLDEVQAGPNARIVTRVERIQWQGGETLAYVLALPRPGSDVVDAFELWLTGPQGCDTRRFLTWR